MGKAAAALGGNGMVMQAKGKGKEGRNEGRKEGRKEGRNCQQNSMGIVAPAGSVATPSNIAPKHPHSKERARGMCMRF